MVANPPASSLPEISPAPRSCRIGPISTANLTHSPGYVARVKGRRGIVPSGIPLAFYDAPEVNDSALKVMGEPTLKTIARGLTESVRRNVSLDWTVRENVRAQMRVRVRRILCRYGYPPDKLEPAMQAVLAQAEVLSHD
jgi:Domain of unknown function (DUF3387)